MEHILINIHRRIEQRQLSGDVMDVIISESKEVSSCSRGIVRLGRMSYSEVIAQQNTLLC